jgi:carboxypeptidase PM20D1
MIRKLLVALGLGLLVLVGVLLVRTATFGSRQLAVEPAPTVAIDAAAAAQRLAGALRIPTISWEDPARRSAAPFQALHAYLAESFPLAHQALTVERVLDHSLLYTWQGSDPSLEPLLLMAHQDVVPVEPGTETDWAHPPFAGRIVDGYVWGRGAMDNKSGVLGLLEAVEMLLAEGHRPLRTVLLAFGHDEEVGGEGARATAALLAGRGTRLALVLDEGGIISEGMVPGLEAPVALVGTAEKGYLSLELSVRTAGGHSSMPPRQTAVGILSRAVTRLEDRPFPGGLRGPTREMFRYLGPEMPLPQRLVFANTWLFGPLIERQLAAAPATDATLRTTTAPTMFEGSVKDNILPIHARAVVNFRIVPGESVQSVTERVRRTVADERIGIAVHQGFGNDPSPVSPAEADAFRALHRTVRQVFPEVLVAPFLVVGATDSRHYTGLSDHVFRFLPIRAASEDLARVHGTNERIAVDQHADGIRFYRQLILNAAG